jgi:hypothetical protein
MNLASVSPGGAPAATTADDLAEDEHKETVLRV